MADDTRGSRKVRTGTVVSDKMDKTIVVPSRIVPSISCTEDH